jgi:hypothetical protein
VKEKQIKSGYYTIAQIRNINKVANQVEKSLKLIDDLRCRCTAKRPCNVCFLVKSLAQAKVILQQMKFE